MKKSNSNTFKVVLFFLVINLLSFRFWWLKWVESAVPDNEAEALVRLHCPHCFANYVTRGDCSEIFRSDKTHP